MMKNNWKTIITKIQKYSVLISTLILCGLFFNFLHNLKPRFERVEEDYKAGLAVNLSAKTPAEDLSAVLYSNGYVNDKRDAEFVANTIADKLKHERFSNLYDLQKREKGLVAMLAADSAGVLADKVARSKELVGLTDSLPRADTLGTSLDLRSGDGVITVRIKADSNYDGVVVRVKEHYLHPDTVTPSEFFLKTDTSGVASITGLDMRKGYSVLPIRLGYEYGRTQGIECGKFADKKDKKHEFTFEFEQMEHRFQMIGNATLKRIKNDGTITVRTPGEYTSTVTRWFVLVLLGWWALYLLLVRRKRYFDPVMVAAAMFLTGFCVIMMFSIQNPLTEDLRGAKMALGVLGGLGAAILLQFVDFIKFYQGRCRISFDPLHSLFPTLLPKGIIWLLLALLLTAMLWPFGQSVGGMKVNLILFGFKFQPSEIAKFLILFFMAAYFTQRADTIIAYSRPQAGGISGNLWSKTKTLGWVFFGLTALMFMYIFLGDMGPGLVTGVTFVLLYSLVKSKVNLENLNEEDKWHRIFTCDFAILIYGVVSFALLTTLTGIILSKLTGTHGDSLIGALLWFVGWIAMGLLPRRKRFYETAFVMNLLISIFLFGGQIIPMVAGAEAGERFEQRISMCDNPWGDLDIAHGGRNAEAVSNTQVANGLWGMATGGLDGQGLGKGNPNLIPEFYNDMILSSIGEQTGLLGLLLVLAAMALLLRRIVVSGYNVGHPFAFYFCIGVAIVTGVQFFIMALGSVGMIPLTGVTVPFLSSGRVSMVFNLVAFGIILSLMKNTHPEQREDSAKGGRGYKVRGYNYPVSFVSFTFVVLAFIAAGAWLHYCLLARNSTLVHPAYVHNREGLPLIEYNPRIALLTKEMWAGDILDRNGVLLATSDRNKIKPSDYVRYGLKKADVDSVAAAHTKRYYPFGEHLFFMLGDINSGLYFSYNEDCPIGYMAEAQHLSYLRDYDNVMRDGDNHPVTVKLKGNYRPTNDRYAPPNLRDTTIRYVVRDNSDLTKYLKDGIYGKRLKKHNQKVKDKKLDLKLTVDAALQTKMQNKLIAYIKNPEHNLNTNNYLRISVVVLDAANGDLLTSANYPLPDYGRLVQEEEDARNQGKQFAVFSDYRKGWRWKTYTDRDLGLTFQTAPGSTAKVMSAMAGLQKMGADAASEEYLVTKNEIIERASAEEPYKGKTYYNREKAFTVDKVTMRLAIVESSNCYFINLVNDKDLYRNLDSIYETVGIRVDTVTPYYLNYTVNTGKKQLLQAIVASQGNAAVTKYRHYKRDWHRRVMNDTEWQWAWGQGNIAASPLNMARVASAIVNGGVMPTTQYVLPTEKNKKTKELRREGGIRLLSKKTSEMLREMMLAESKNQFYRQKQEVSLPGYVGGKTGTPERVRIDRDRQRKPNDGWYMFFVKAEGCTSKHPLAVAVRMERGVGSGTAVRLTQSVILPTLRECGYIH